MKPVTLFTPGPVQVKPEWMQQMAEPFMHHRTNQFQQLMERLQPKLQATFQTQQPVLVMAGSGSAAMEAAIVNLFSPTDHVLVVSIGYFGDVFAKIATIHGLRVTKLDFPFGSAADPQQVAKALEADDSITGLLITHHETASGVVNDLKAIGAIAAAHDVYVVVDAISGLVMHELKMDAWGLDCVLSASQKSYFLPPGLALCACSERAWERIAQKPVRSYYFDWQNYRQLLTSKHQTPYTPPIPLLIGLEVACDAILAEGLEPLQQRHADLRASIQTRIQTLGYTCAVTDEQAQGNVLVAIQVPSGASQLVAYLETQGYMVAPGQGANHDTIFRIGCIGDLCQDDFEQLYTALAEYQQRD